MLDKRNFDLQIHSDEELGNLNEFALYVISRHYPLISGEEIVLPPGLTMYLRVKRWWIALKKLYQTVRALFNFILKVLKNLYCCCTFSNFVLMYI